MWNVVSQIWFRHRDRKRIVEAVRFGDLELVATFLNAGIDPNLVVAETSLLVYALFSDQRSEMINLLLNHGARFDSPGNDCFLESAIGRDRALVSLACRSGLDINKRVQGFATLDFALNMQDPDLIDFLMELGAAPTVNCRWYDVNRAVIQRLLAWGVAVPDDVRRAVEEGRW